MIKFEIHGYIFEVKGNEISLKSDQNIDQFVNEIFVQFYRFSSGPECGYRGLAFYGRNIKPLGGILIEKRIDEKQRGVIF